MIADLRMLRNASQPFPEKILCILCIDVNQKSMDRQDGQDNQDETLLHEKLTGAKIRYAFADAQECKPAVS